MEVIGIAAVAIILFICLWLYLEIKDV